MLEALRNLIRPRPAEPKAAIPAGERVYAVGDVHGRLDLFEAMIAAIEADEAAQPAARTTLVLLGDLIDRGPDSAGVVAAARRLSQVRMLRVLCGNHEEMLLRSLDDIETFRHFLRFGGRETILSYPVDPMSWARADLEEAQAMMRAAIPPGDFDFIRKFEDWVRIGDYVFVHAGIAPGVPLEQQRHSDLRWIRNEFTQDERDHGFVVVHGHTIREWPEVKRNRIGIDTGAFATGRLTALALEGTTRRLLSVRDVEGKIVSDARPA